MKKKDHRKTRSYGNPAYIAQQKELLKQNRWCTAINMDMRDLNRVAPGKYAVGKMQFMAYLPLIIGRTCAGF